MLLTLDKISRLSGRRLATSGAFSVHSLLAFVFCRPSTNYLTCVIPSFNYLAAAQSGRWISMDVQTSRNAIQDVEQGSQSVHGQQDGQTRPVGTDTMSNQQLFLEMKKMNESIVALRLELPQMEARLSKEAAKNKEDLNKEAAKNKEDLTKLVTDTEGRLKDTAAKNKEDLTKLVADTKVDLKDGISKVEVSQAKVFATATATAGVTLVAGFMAFLRIPGSLWGS